MLELLLEPFVERALLAGVGVAIVAGIMGCFVVWRRMAYFGDSLSHSALLGVALGLLTGLHVSLGMVVLCAVFAVLLVWCQHKRLLSTDTLLGIFAHSALSIGLVAISFLDRRVDMQAYFFGDVLTVSANDVWIIYSVGVLVLLVLARLWAALLLMTLHEDLANAEGVRVWRVQLAFMFLMAVVVALATPVVGILLITSMLIIPAATARQLAHSPESMAGWAAVIGSMAVVIGVGASLGYDTPTGPSIVCAAAGLFLVALLCRVAGAKLK